MNTGFSRWTSYLVPLFHPPYRGNKKVSKSSYDPLAVAAARSEDSLSRLLPLSSLLSMMALVTLSPKSASWQRVLASAAVAVIVALRSPVAVP